MAIDLNLFERKNTKKAMLSCEVYEETLDTLRKFCVDKQIKLSHLLRHLVNEFIDENVNNTKRKKG